MLKNEGWQSLPSTQFTTRSNWFLYQISGPAQERITCCVAIVQGFSVSPGPVGGVDGFGDAAGRGFGPSDGILISGSLQGIFKPDAGHERALLSIMVAT